MSNLFPSSKFFLSAVMAAVLLTLTSCATYPARAADTDRDNNIQAAWVVLGDGGRAVARVITSAASCPDLIQDGVPQRMSVRAQAETIAQRHTASSADDSKPSAFPVLTCEVMLNPVAKSAGLRGSPLPLPQAEPRKMVVIADTGCRMKKVENAFQACSEVSDWPFKTISETAAAFKPDLVIPVGDYHYRENACPDGNAGCVGSAWGYGWDTWRADLFEPAAALMRAWLARLVAVS